MDSLPTPDPTRFHSLLWPSADAAAAPEAVAAPDCFHDLNLDQVVAAIAAAWPGENLAPYFHAPLHDVACVHYRQAIFRDLEQAPIRQALLAFVERMRAMRAQREAIAKLFYPREQQRALLEAANHYRMAVTTLASDLARLAPASGGLRALHAYLVATTSAQAFRGFDADAGEVLSALDGVRYTLVIHESSIVVRHGADEPEASAAIEETFARFRHDAVKDYRTRRRGRIGVNGINHIEAQVLDRVALLHPQAFAALDGFCNRHAEFVDATVARCARELCFYLAWHAFVEPLRAAGLAFCQPQVDAGAKAVEAADAFDIALAAQRIDAGQAVVCNGFTLAGAERMLVVTGPNHGGKTTFARMFGQLHWLASLGCSVPGTRARLFLCDRLFTHFENEEHIETLRGKLQDDLYRIHRILAQATPRSLIVLNEIFASTTLDDALWLGRRIMARLAQLDAPVVCVTFLDELATFDEKTVSMVAGVDPRDPAIRTYKVTRRPPDGLAHALAVAEKHRVTHDWLLQRIAP